MIIPSTRAPLSWAGLAEELSSRNSLAIILSIGVP